ncbi:uncharacterized protein DSM5745_09920 [Aspergillus mulundensis]|uniref:Uncharacterized protein n=1 Tax=Aspergillus mulundensis TaxID=1810919 RepID=A0A3D8QRR9_9EURO|nr:hypothetical protein DSM5745_09920 [Aspergillus mulundensis]RDW64509.1 hypothetical protein DSM5745_09920 [Aspergillus mulundensis]
MAYPFPLKEVNNIWKGIPPSPAPSPDPSYPDLDPTNLAQYTRDELINYMGMYPDHAVSIFDYGKKQPHLWPNIPRIDSEAELVAWHNKTFPTTPLPQPRETIHANILTLRTRSPIDQLIKTDKIHALIALHRSGRWPNPHGFTRQCSYAYLAWNNGQKKGPSFLAFHYILYTCKRNRDWAFERPSAPTLTGIPGTGNHLDFIIRHSPEAFFSIWPHQDKVGPGPLDLAPSGNTPLQPRSISQLLKHAEPPQLSKLRERNNLDLALNAPGP